MGRYETGVTTVNGAHKIEMSYLIKRGYFSCFGSQYGKHKQSMSWTSGSRILVETVHSPKETYLRLDYTITSNSTGEQTKMDYIVRIEFKPSNLGKGFVPYFICPISFKRCRILYRAFGSHHFKAREAYQSRLYYEAQKSSKKFRQFERFISVRHKVEGIWQRKGRNYNTFKGKPTKFHLKLEAMEKKLNGLDELTVMLMLNNL